MKSIYCFLLFVFLAVSLFAAQSVTLAWDPSVDTSVTSYVLYYGKASSVYGSRLNAGTNLITTVSNLASGTWFFVVTARDDRSSLESDPSNEVWCTVGTNQIVPPVSKFPRVSLNLESARDPLGPWQSEWVGVTNLVVNLDRAFYRARMDLVISP